MSEESNDKKESKVVVYSRNMMLERFLKGQYQESAWPAEYVNFIDMDALVGHYVLGQQAKGEKMTLDAAFVDMDADLLEGVTPSDLAMRVAKEHPEKKILLFSWQPIKDLWLSAGFRSAMSYRNADFVRLPATVPQVFSVYLKRKLENPAFRAAANLEQESSIVGKFKHDWKYDDRKENILKIARDDLGWNGSDSDIEQRIIVYAPSSSVEPAYFPGVFCDVEGTILKEGKLDDGIVKELGEISAANPVNLWTGADLEEYSHLVSTTGYPLLSKHWFRGSTVEQAIDDDPKELFEANYGITANNYRKV